MPYFVLICLTVLAAAGAIELLSPCRSAPPPWLALCNATFSLVMTLALTLNLLSQLCPPSGRDLCLIPAYVLMCVPRMGPSGRALALQAGAAVLLLGVFVAVPTTTTLTGSYDSNNNNNSTIRPSGDVGGGWVMLGMSLLAAAGLQTFSFQSEALELQLVRPSRLWKAGAVVCKGLLLLALGVLSDTYLYSFMFETKIETRIEKRRAPAWLLGAYGVLLLFACMQAASAWLGHLKEALGQRVKWRLVVRIQHVIHALIVAAAWVFPLQLHSLRVLVMGGLFWVNLVHKLYF